jgi:type III secretory pathway component EscU
MSFAKVDQYIPSDLIEPVAEILVALRRLADNELPGAVN